jgi:hypothetical protein
MSKPVKTYWFVEPHDDLTNRVLAEALQDQDPVSGKMCADGKLHNLWKCSHLELTRLLASMEGLTLKFTPFVQRGNGPVNEWRFERKRKLKKREMIPA